MNTELHKIRDMFLGKVLKDYSEYRDEMIKHISEDDLTARVLSPMCILDIAYEMWQELKPEFSFKTKQQYNAIQKMFFGTGYMKSVFGKDGILYYSMTEEQVTVFNDYCEMVRENTDKQMQSFFYAAQRPLMQMEDVHARQVCSKLVMIVTMITFVYEHIDMEYKCRTPILIDICHGINHLFDIYSRQKVKGKYFKVEYQTDENFVLALKCFWNSVKLTKITTKAA